jgi:hypothetical protein
MESFESFGARIRIEAAERIASSVSFQLPPRARRIEAVEFDTVYTIHDMSDESPKGSLTFRVSRNGEEVAWFEDLDDARFEVESDLHFRVAVAAKDHLFVHAGVVEVDGRAIVVPGRTLSGKSSLVMALVATGARYYSDEYAVFDSDGLVHPYRKPLSQRVPDQHRPRLHTLDELGVEPDDRALPVSLTVITRYVPHGRWKPEPVSRADAVMALFENTVVARARPEFALQLLAKAVNGSAGVRSERAEAAEAATGILNAVRPPPP